MSKGSNARPFSVPREEFDKRWEQIFGKKDLKEEKSKPKPDSGKTK